MTGAQHTTAREAARNPLAVTFPDLTGLGEPGTGWRDELRRLRALDGVDVLDVLIARMRDRRMVELDARELDALTALVEVQRGA